MKRLTLTSVALYLLLQAIVAAAYVVAWFTDFDRDDA